MTKKNDTPKGGESRREFLKAGSLAAAGIIITPILAACGGDEKPTRPRGSSTTSPAPTGNGTGKGATTTPPPSGGLTYVKTVAELGDVGTLKLMALTGAAAAEKYITITDDKSDKEKARAVNGGKGPIDETGLVTVDAGGGKVGVANVMFDVKVSTGKALECVAEPTGVNGDFRFTRNLVVGKGKQVAFVVKDDVSHNLSLKMDSRSGGGGTGGMGETLKSDPLKIPGLYNVSCTMHTWEGAFVLVSQHAHVGVTGNPHDPKEYQQGALDGSVTLENVPVGKHKVDVYHEGKVVQTIDVEVVKGETKSFEVKL